jgi:hypothetical protein
MKELKIYVAGKVSKDSVFGTHYWRDEFVQKLEELSGLNLISFDPAKKEVNQNFHEDAFGADIYMISKADVVIVYLSDDISVGGSQEILVGQYYNKPVIGLAPLGGKFHNKNKEIFGQLVKEYKHPFVYGTCDVVCDDIEGVAKALKNLEKIKPKSINLIKKAADKFEKEKLKSDKYMRELFEKE